MVYPQDDYVFKEYLGQYNLFTVKAHNWFLQEWTETGLIGTLCLLAFYLWYALRSIRIYRRCSLKESVNVIGFGIFVGTVSYMAAGVVSDANVCTAPVFWVMLGLGMAVNRMVVAQEGLFIQAAPASPASPETEASTAAASHVETPAQTPATSASGTKPAGKKKQSRKQRKRK
jgi:O-antigen ligase